MRFLGFSKIFYGKSVWKNENGEHILTMVEEGLTLIIRGPDAPLHQFQSERTQATIAKLLVVNLDKIGGKRRGNIFKRIFHFLIILIAIYQEIYSDFI